VFSSFLGGDFMKKEILKSIILFITGMCLYITIEVFFRGYSFRLMGIVGGILMCFVFDKINDKISWDLPLVIQMLIGGFATTLLELISGEFALHILDVRMWDYSGQWLSMFDNLICPLFSFIWCLLSGIAIVLCDAINYYLIHDEIRPYYRSLYGDILFQLPERKCH